jgi:tRNA dimethylallyltransferase
MSSRILVVTGLTGSGKTRFSIFLSRLLDGEIISADSRQLYRYMDIGTAKPSRAELEAVKHHFIDILNPDEDYNAGRFAKEARPVIDDIIARNRMPIVVGGSGLYIESLIDGFFEGPSADIDFRERYHERYKKEGGEVLLQELRIVDPDAASKMHPTNIRRIIRALEVYHITGTPISSLQRDTKPIQCPTYFVALDWDRELLYRNIDDRVEKMLDGGLIAEVESLQKQDYSKNLNALQTVGYKEVFQYLEGELTHDQMVELIKRNSRRYAKRQLTWFRPDTRIHWLPVDDTTNLELLAKKAIRDLPIG